MLPHTSKREARLRSSSSTGISASDSTAAARHRLEYLTTPAGRAESAAAAVAAWEANDATSSQRRGDVHAAECDWPHAYCSCGADDESIKRARLVAIRFVLDDEEAALQWLRELDEGDLQAIHWACQEWKKYAAMVQQELPAPDPDLPL